MNKAIIIIAVLAAAAFIIQFTGTYNIIGAIIDLPSKAGTFTADPIKFVQDNAASLATAVTSIGGCTTIFSFIYSKIKKESTQAITQEKELRLEQGQELLNITQQKEAAQKLAQDKLAEVTAAQATAQNAIKEAEAAKAQIVQLEKEKSELKRLFNYVDDKVELTKKPLPIP